MIERNLVEVGAKILHDNTPVFSPIPWDELSDTAKHLYRVTARKVILAMREPTEEMIEAGSDAVYAAGGPPTQAAYAQAKAAWQAMIRKAAGEKP